MDDKNCNTLLEYMNGMLCGRKMNKTDLADLEEPFRKVGEGLTLLEARMREMEAQLAEYNGLLVELTRRRREWILVVDTEKREVVYCNQRGAGSQSQGYCENCERRLSFLSDVRVCENAETVERIDDVGRVFHDTSFEVEWLGRRASAHVIMDVTDGKQNEKKLMDKAYRDSLTGIYNRLYFGEYMQRLLAEGIPFTLCYLDLDDIKGVNDRLGHPQGDTYLRSFTAIVSRHFRSDDMFARIGGDEFCIVLKGCSQEVAWRKLAEAREDFRRNHPGDYAASFSFGALYVDAHTDLTQEEIIRQADELMYQCKRKHKEESV